MSDNPEVEFTARYATSVDDLAAAWSFVMGHIDQVGEHPHISIKPFWTISVRDMDSDDDDWPRKFGVVVAGHFKQGEGWDGEGNV